MRSDVPLLPPMRQRTNHDMVNEKNSGTFFLHLGINSGNVLLHTIPHGRLRNGNRMDDEIFNGAPNSSDMMRILRIYAARTCRSVDQ